MRGLEPEAAFDAALAAQGPLPALGLAVSGGSDSTALAVIAARWAAPRGMRLAAVTVDHGLRAEAAGEAAAVAALCARLGIAHQIRVWDGTRKGNLMATARAGRTALIADWATGQGLPAVALGHTMDDQAETLLMNLGRGSGVDGLSAMPAARRAGGILWLRPLLAVRRDALRDLLRAAGIVWAEDPTNADARYLRPRLRQAIPALGLQVERLAETARQMQELRALIDAATQDAAGRVLRIEAGDAILDPAVLDLTPAVRDRLLVHLLGWIGRAPDRPRQGDVARVVVALTQKRPATLAGCRILPGPPIRLGRESARAVALGSVPAPGPWDGRWRIPGAEKGSIRALGQAGLAERPDWREAGLPRATLLASPALWDGARLVSAPLLEPDGPFRAEVDPSGLFAAPEAH